MGGPSARISGAVFGGGDEPFGVNIPFGKGTPQKEGRLHGGGEKKGQWYCLRLNKIARKKAKKQN